MTTPIIREACAQDAAACAAIYAPYVRDTTISFELVPPDAAEFARRIAAYGQSHLWLVAEREGELAGYAYASPFSERAAYAQACEVGVYLAMGSRGAGLGRALYAALLPGLTARGQHTAIARIALPNPASVALHQRCGFTPAGVLRQVGRKHGQWVDVGLWQLLLQPGLPMPPRPV